MTILRSPRARVLLLVVGLILPWGLGGCGSGNPNEQEFQRSAPPGKPLENPNESYAERRERTRNVSKQLAKIEAQNDAATKKLKADAEKSKADAEEKSEATSKP